MKQNIELAVGRELVTQCYITGIIKHDITGIIEAGAMVGALPVALWDNPWAAVPHPLISRCDTTQPQLEKTQ
jgi:hypothetical protein